MSDRIARALAKVRENVNNTWVDSPLGGLAERISENLRDAESALSGGSESQSKIQQLIKDTERTLAALPHSFGDRFDFDTLLSRDVLSQWKRNQSQIPADVVPNYTTDDWGYLERVIPKDRDKGWYVRIVELPGADILEDINLRDYVFLIHELAHAVYSLNAWGFRERLSAALTDSLNRLRLRGVADREAVRALVRQRHEKLSKLWQPKPTSRDWSHELAIDVTCTWLLGPLYVNYMTHLVEKRAQDPIHITNEHPPYLARVEGCRVALDECGWGAEARQVRETKNLWISKVAQHPAYGEFGALAQEDIIELVVRESLQECRSAGLPQLDPAQLADIERRRDRSETLRGIEVIVAAQAMRVQNAPEQFEPWQRRVIAAYLDSATR